MQVKIIPSEVKNGLVEIPCSKSMAHRAIICASLADGFSRITNVDYSVDIDTTIQGMTKLGAKITKDGKDVLVQGIKSFDDLKNNSIECNESGSTLRFLIPIFSMTDKKIRFTGKNRLLKRPQKVYEDLFLKQGNHYQQTEEFIEIEGKIKPGEITLPGDVSSQFISGLLFTLPLCKEVSKLHILPPFESRSYVLLTIEMLEKYGIHIYWEDDYTITIPGNQKYLAHDERVEGDYSQLGFFSVLGAINQDIKCLNLKKDSLQGDKKIIDILKTMGAQIEEVEEGYLFKRSTLKGTEIDLADCPDLGPILMTVATFATGETKIINAGRLRLKESDRISAMEEELKKLGANITSTEDTVTIIGPTKWNTKEILNGHKDHRIVMSLAVGATMAELPIVIDEAESISKSYPNFFEDLKKQGIKVEVIV